LCRPGARATGWLGSQCSRTPLRRGRQAEDSSGSVLTWHPCQRAAGRSLCHQRPQTLQVLRPLSLSKRRATTQGIGEPGTLPERFRDQREDAAEMVFQQMLQQAGSYGGAEIGVGVSAPLPREAPYFLRVLLNVVSNTDDGLPAWIQPAVGGHLSRQNPLCPSYGLEHGHRFRTRHPLRRHS